MLARALLNAVIAVNNAGILKGGTSQPGRVGGWLGVMTALTAFDYTLARQLR